MCAVCLEVGVGSRGRKGPVVTEGTSAHAAVWLSCSVRTELETNRRPRCSHWICVMVFGPLESVVSNWGDCCCHCSPQDGGELARAHALFPGHPGRWQRHSISSSTCVLCRDLGVGLGALKFKTMPRCILYLRFPQSSCWVRCSCFRKNSPSSFLQGGV